MVEPNIKQSKSRTTPSRPTLHGKAAEAQKQILQAPKQAWTNKHHKGKPALSYTVRSSVVAGQEHVLRSLLGGQDFLDPSAIGRSTIAVTQADQVTRMDVQGKSAFGSDCTFIQDDEQGKLFLDKKSQMYLHLPVETKIASEYKEKLRGSVKVHETEQGATAVLTIDAPYSVRYELKFDTRREYRPFAKEAVCRVIGCDGKFLKAGLDLSPLLSLGIPVSGTTYMVRPGEKPQAVTSFEVLDIKLGEASDDDFGVPQGYTDLRKHHAEQAKPHTAKVPINRAEARQAARAAKHDDCIDGLCSLRPTGPVANTAPGGHGAHGTTDGNGSTGKPGYTPGAYDTGIGTSQSALTLATNERGMPRCFADETYGSLIANVVDQKLLDDVKYLANGVTRRLTGFAGSGGALDIDWMTQFQTFSDALADGDAGGGLFSMLHDVDALSASHPTKFGLLDRLAVVNLANLLAAGDSLSNLSLNAALQAAVNAVIANAAIAATDRFTSLTQDQQSQLIDAYVMNGIGKLALTYPETTGTQTIFHDLLNVRLDDIAFDVAINNTSLINTLNFDNSGVHLVVNLPSASGQAFLTRWPSTLYWTVLAASAIACFFLPFLCGLMTFVILVGVFIITDIAYISIDLDNLSIDAHITLTPNGAGVLQPSVTLALDADVSVVYASVIPSGIHQILSLIYTIVGSQTDIILDTIEDQLQTALNDLVRSDLAVSYPPAFGPLALAGVASSTEFVMDDHGYVEQALDAGIHNLINPYVTQIDSEVKSKILAMRDDFKATYTDPVDQFTTGGGLLAWPGTDFTNVARYYGGTVLSQNFINQYVYTIWLQGEFTRQFAGTELEELYAMLQQVYPALGAIAFTDVGFTAKLWPAVPPRTVFTPKPASEGQFYATTFFDDVRLCLGLKSKTKLTDVPAEIEFVFATQVSTELGFGGLNGSTGKLDLLKLGDRAFDIYFDLTGLGVRVIVPETQRFVRPDLAASIHVDYTVLDNANLQGLFSRAMLMSLAKRDKGAIPRATGDDAYIQRYPLGDPAATAVFVLVPFQGNLYVSHGLSGLATAIYEGALDIDQLTRSEATLIRAFI